MELLPHPDPFANKTVKGRYVQKNGDIDFEAKMFLGRIRIWYDYVIMETTYERTCQNLRPRIPRPPHPCFQPHHQEPRTQRLPQGGEIERNMQ